MRPRNQKGTGAIGQSRVTDDPSDPRNRRNGAVSSVNLQTASNVPTTDVAGVPVSTVGIADPIAGAAFAGVLQRIAVLEASYNDLLGKLQAVRLMERGT